MTEKHTLNTAGGLLIGRMQPATSSAHRLHGTCPDGGPCTLPVFCSQLCSRLESAEITAELQARAKGARLAPPHFPAGRA